ncbi:hypothetical protein [Sphingobacterium sp.]|uniref:hypothetical protein n=1 Tax=Sphingobacterium sp. TaxID=341027 RepID=UPI0031D82790
MAQIKIDFQKLSLQVLSILLLLFMAVQAYYILSSEPEQLLAYLNLASREPLADISGVQLYILTLVAIVSIIAFVLLVVAAIRLEVFTTDRPNHALKWGLYAVLLALVIYGGLLRSISNQQGAALLFFAASLVFLLIGWINYNEVSGNCAAWKLLRNLPVYAMLLYTMGLPGYVKLFNAAAVIPRYERMFKDSFIAQLPGGTSFMILIMGVFELLVTLLLLASLLKAEFKVDKSKPILNLALLLAIITFSMLCFGLMVINNYQGAINLVFYAIFTFFLLVATHSKEDLHL